MKFTLSRPILDEKLCSIVCREMRKQKLQCVRANKSHLKEMASVSRAVAKNGLPKNLVWKKLPNKLGYGIFLHPKAKPILKGHVIASYAGEVSLVPQNCVEDSLYAFEMLSHIQLTKEEQSYFDHQSKYHPRRLYCVYIDAVQKGNFTRFINHSDTPNVVAELFKIPTNSYGLDPLPIEVIYLAKKTIRPGEQLLVCYDGDGNSYWGAMDFKPIRITPKTFQLDDSLKVVGSV